MKTRQQILMRCADLLDLRNTVKPSETEVLDAELRALSWVLKGNE